MTQTKKLLINVILLAKNAQTMEMKIIIIVMNGISNYYQKIDDLKGCFFGNVNGYFLFDNYYQNCYITCNHCYGFGNENNHNCSECI